jgi:hypothetical protein
MSAYQVYECDFVEQPVLLKALTELGLEYKVYNDPQPLRGWEGESRTHSAEIIVPAAELNKSFTSVSNDIGFRWDKSKKRYNLILSDYDKKANVHKRLNQAYVKAAYEKALEQYGFASVSQGDISEKERTKIKVVAKKVV